MEPLIGLRVTAHLAYYLFWSAKEGPLVELARQVVIAVQASPKDAAELDQLMEHCHLSQIAMRMKLYPLLLAERADHQTAVLAAQIEQFRSGLSLDEQRELAWVRNRVAARGWARLGQDVEELASVDEGFEEQQVQLSLAEGQELEALRAADLLKLSQLLSMN